MNTTFSIRMIHSDVKEAARLASQCFQELDRLEDQLSRYRPDSEVSQINAMSAGESILLTDSTYRCLQLAMDAAAATAGLFDPTLGAHTDPPEFSVEEKTTSQEGQFVLSPNRPEITCHQEGRLIDLGGIGKGFALDELARELEGWELSGALLSAGASTHRTVGEKPWKMTLKGDEQTKQIELRRGALSSSGVGFQEGHIVHPDAQSTETALRRIWVQTNQAAYADAFSTACFLMSSEEMEEFVFSLVGEVLVWIEDPQTGAFRAIS
ncbi:MAG: FAD:protein FMN transferase [Verrucomicrobiota bacterium]